MIPLISCIMPTHDRPAFVAQSVRYFLRQDYPHTELIIVDDGAALVRAGLPDDGRVRYVRSRKPLSVGHKRNLACEEARGEIIAHWDDDDWYAPHRLGHQVAPLLAGRADICGLEPALFLDVEQWRGWQLAPALYARMFVGGVHGATLMYWRALWGSLSRFPDSSLGEDAAFLHKTMERGARAMTVPHAGSFIYLRHAHNTWRFEAGQHIDPAGWTPIKVEDWMPPQDCAFYAGMLLPA
jgi:O-antigen biosynthesis protein